MQWLWVNGVYPCTPRSPGVKISNPLSFRNPFGFPHFARALDSTEAHPASGKIQTQRRQRRYAIGQELQGGIVDLSLRDLTMNR